MNLFKSNKLVGVATLVTATFAALSLATTNKAGAVSIPVSQCSDFLLNCNFQEDSHAFSFEINPQPFWTEAVWDIRDDNIDGTISIDLNGTYWKGTVIVGNPNNSIEGVKIFSNNIRHEIGPHTEDVNPGEIFSFTQSILSTGKAIVGGPPILVGDFQATNPTVAIVNHEPHFDSYKASIEILKPIGPNLELQQWKFSLSGVHIPEPSPTLSLLALGTLGAASTLKRQLKPSKSTEKATTKVG
ncbi:hypothetical protein PN437_06435 [Microcystis aeruginosa CS-564/01]|uniref:hypothetical protein n=1 Tax=Microcystis aeruginosa TaxID=1126 RepID=UPI002330962C|nr:hypothetical protein [Microcystis aeruginosa]MDB9424549.1 hypothetical protein [Microcystis aeruginosa CS-564/01]